MSETPRRAIVDRLRRDPGLMLVLVAVAAVIALYAPTLGRGLVNFDDTWLVRDNFLLHHPSLKTIFFDTSAETRFVLGAEYLPVRDVSIAIDYAIWGDFYGGYHLTNLVLYLLAIGLWFGALVELGFDRTLAGLAILIWALHPAHAESIAWISERKGLLGIAFAGLACLGYARFRIGRSAWWLVVAVCAAVLAVWSKALFAFAIAALAPLELFVPAPRVSRRRTLVGLGAIAVAGALAFVPVVLTAINLRVVATADEAPAGWLAMVIGVHGYYLELGALAPRNAISYPISTLGPSAIDLVVGAVGLVVAIGAIAWPRSPRVLRCAAILWLIGWLPASRLVLPLHAVLVSDRYILFGSLGLALAAAYGLLAIGRSRARTALVIAIALAASMRTLDAQSSWRDSATLWHRAVVTNPDDGVAWASYVEALEDAAEPERAFDALAEGLRHSRSPRLLLRKALLLVERGIRPDAVAAMRTAAEGGEPRAMANLAVMLLQDGKLDEALTWAMRSVEVAPLYAKGYRALGGILLSMHRAEEALAAFEKAHKLMPAGCEDSHDQALALIELGRGREARRPLELCVDDPKVGGLARGLLGRLPP